MTTSEVDWNAEWMRLSDRRAVRHDAEFWDRRAREFRGGGEESPYVRGFIEAMRILPGEGVLDVGCGSGALALPLARAGHPVTGLDFSQGMLARLREHADREAPGVVTTVLSGWDDDWRAAGVEPADVAVASRSLDVRDLRAALGKLGAFARRRVCVSVPTDGLLYPGLLARAAVGRPAVGRGEQETAVGVLRQMGIEPEVRLLEHTSVSHYESPQSALDSLTRMIRPADEPERQALERYVAEHLVQTEGDEGRPVWTQEPAIPVRWTFLAWDAQATG